MPGEDDGVRRPSRQVRADVFARAVAEDFTAARPSRSRTFKQFAHVIRQP
jgi:hypothetical protein